MASLHSSLFACSTWFQLMATFIFLLSLLPRVDPQNRSHEVCTLLDFKQRNALALDRPYASIDDVFDTLEYWINWNEDDVNPCAWAGVTCTDNYTVSQLDFSGWGFGYVSNLEVLSNLPDLRQLDLSSNVLLYFPSNIEKLTGLTLLDISWNGLAFSIPSNISALRSLRSLFLQENDLAGEILILCGLVNLQFLSLAENSFFGPLPNELGELSRLVSLDLSHNNFEGSISSLPNLTKLVCLKLDNNSFTDFKEPWFLGANSTLQHLSLSFNQLEGFIPSGITSLVNLKVLDLSCNNLSGPIPSGFAQQAGKSFSFDFSQNQLTREIPADMLQHPRNIGDCGSLNLSHNLLTGRIPIDGVNYNCFDALDLSHNSLSGAIPSFSEKAVILTSLRLQNNHISGDIVDCLGNPGFSEIYELLLQNNLLTGDLSRIVNITLERLSSLIVLDLSNNSLRWSTSEANPDPIKATLWALSSITQLQDFWVGGNNFSGTSLPTSCFGYGLEFLDLSNNYLNGEILGEVFSNTCLPYLQVLNLSNNGIIGPVPHSIVGIQYLAVFDVSNNHLSGSLPTIPLNSPLVNPSFFGGNLGLCGYPLPSCPSQGSSLHWWVLLIIIGGSVTIALASCFAATWQWRVYRKRHQQDEDLIKILLERDSAIVMPLRELKKATNNFDKSAQIGEGGFGIVYRGKCNNGTVVAIKRSKREGSEEDKEQFLNEVRILSHVNHRNLVKLLSCCMENKVAALVFEFVSNGTLQDHLQGKIGAVHLSWKQRLHIAIQSADALNYLHSGATFPIYHRDVKSANILLDDDLNAKVADFGISRLAPMKATHVSTIGMGTMGYIDPEYWTSFQLTDKSDVYSFGVVLLELLSAQPAIDFKKCEEEKSLVIFANPHIKSGELQGLIDPTLMEFSDEPIGRESILNVGRLALKCVEIRSKARPSMNQVLKELQNLWHQFNDKFTHLGSIKEDDNEDSQRHDIILLCESFTSDSSRSTMQSDVRCVQMAEFSCPASFQK